MRKQLRTCLALYVIVLVPTMACAQSDPWAAVGRVLQTENLSASPYHKYNLPRTDLKVMMGDVDASAVALGGWVGFSGQPTDATMMGDLVVTSGELGPVLGELAAQRIDVTAVHNHLAGETPQVFYVHIYGQGAAADLATRVNRAVARTGVPRPEPAPRAQPVQIDTAQVHRVLGKSGSASGTVAHVSFQLVPGDVTMNGRTVDPSMGYGTAIAVQMVGDDRAVATGDFAVLGPAVTPVLQALAQGGVTATAVHTHLIGETPQIRYIHFWADGPLDKVLRGIRSAVDAAH